jgi:hypothetical protein
MQTIRITRPLPAPEGLNIFVGRVLHCPYEAPLDKAKHWLDMGWAEAVPLKPFKEEHGGRIRLKSNLSHPSLPHCYYAGAVVSVPGEVPEDMARAILSAGFAVGVP